MTSEHVAFRYVEAIRRGEAETAAMLARDVLDCLGSDFRMERWMAHRGCGYQQVAEQFNKYFLG